MTYSCERVLACLPPRRPWWLRAAQIAPERNWMRLSLELGLGRLVGMGSVHVLPSSSDHVAHTKPVVDRSSCSSGPVPPGPTAAIVPSMSHVDAPRATISPWAEKLAPPSVEMSAPEESAPPPGQPSTLAAPLGLSRQYGSTHAFPSPDEAFPGTTWIRFAITLGICPAASCAYTTRGADHVPPASSDSTTTTSPPGFHLLTTPSPCLICRAHSVLWL
mmetsp:Transcript_33887/g.107629  ORF Transcript_33887/g.107629 Transcript_33887/m.107629 type:complete len:218 (-) Transcript_33887:411-1064(-)